MKRVKLGVRHCHNMYSEAARFDHTSSISLLDLALKEVFLAGLLATLRRSLN